ncbi:MAG: ribonuclease P protein component [Bacteroidetes bacterium]|nr:ribonuclease P protein component [Bacteroidota bacterium]
MDTDTKTPSGNKLPKLQRLHGKKAVSMLFSSGTSFFQYPFKIVTSSPTEPTKVPLRFMVSISKRNFKNATDRNRIKRQVREAWRTQKQPLDEVLIKQQKNLDVAFIFTSKNILPSSEINNKIKRVIERLKQDHEVHHTTSG